MSNQITEIFEKLSQTRLVVLGDLMVDRFIWGIVQRISPEAPVPIVLQSREELMPGGAGNVVRNLAALGCPVSVVSAVGRDAHAEFLSSYFAKLGISPSGLIKVADRKTACKTRIIAEHQHVLRLDDEKNDSINQPTENELLKKVKDGLSGAKGIILSDYNKGVLTQSLIQHIVEMCKSRKIPVFVDPKGNRFAKYRGATYITPNKAEAILALGGESACQLSVLELGKTLLQKIEVENVLITLGKDGMELFSKNKSVVHFSTEAREVYDVSGAGDTVIAVLSAFVSAGSDPVSAVKAANVAAGIAVGKLGTATVLASELAKALQDAGSEHQRGKILTADNLTDTIHKLKHQKKRIVFTNGCFDVLHAGHVDYLRKARNLGDVLMVGVNSDESMAKLKGKDRPLTCESDRISILASLEFVDYLFLFGEDTPLKLISQILPDVLVKGGDYQVNKIVGAKVVEKNGGQVVTIPLLKGRSTTMLIKKIKQT